MVMVFSSSVVVLIQKWNSILGMNFWFLGYAFVEERQKFGKQLRSAKTQFIIVLVFIASHLLLERKPLVGAPLDEPTRWTFELVSQVTRA